MRIGYIAVLLFEGGWHHVCEERFLAKKKIAVPMVWYGTVELSSTYMIWLWTRPVGSKNCRRGLSGAKKGFGDGSGSILSLYPKQS
mmetsp:Transcript_9195/g.17511  ORF Transcript_9195/g.17511 Transcript_9195/m.17511 type:complete len:86 (-) Transcript_9195:569-826(-)